MHWLSHGVEQLVEAATHGDPAGAPEVLVVGSGYGGAVAALRFAEHGQQVAVLERGSEYQAGEFPTDFGQFGGWVRADVSGANGAAAIGYEDALFDFRIGQRASALVGNGLGGGSLINAAVALRPDARVFAQDTWPGPLRGQSLDADYARAYDGLEIQSPESQKASPACVPQNTLKYQRLQDIGQAAQARFASSRLSVQTEDVPLAIEFRKDAPLGLGPREACVGCGDCCSGCNHNAKLSLDKTYLPRARKAGARMYTGVSVLYVQHRPDVAHPGRDWVVHCVRTTERAAWEQASGTGKPEVLAAYEFCVRAGRVVLSAGTFGSTEVLLRSQAKGLPVANTWLGKGISANGDDLSAAYDLKDVANAMGEGSGPVRPQTVGPTISGVIRFHDHEDHTRSTVTEDGGIPGMLGAIADEMMTTLGLLPQLARFGLRSLGRQDPLAVRPDAIRRSLVLLGMGHDSAAGQAQLASDNARLSWGWGENANDPAPRLHRARAASVEAAGAEFVPNPMSGVLPDKIASVLSGPKGDSGWITVHPLGGCRMGSAPHLGVVNHQGQVYKPNGEVYAGLMVMDGSVIPTSLGVNPLLTITALAERACRLVLQDITPANAPQVELPAHPPKVEPLKADPHAPRGAILAEVLRGPLQTLQATDALPVWLRGTEGAQVKDAALFLEMDVPDWKTLWQDPRHTVRPVLGNANSRSLTSSRLVVDQAHAPSVELQVTGGHIELFSAAREWFPRRLVRMLRVGLTYWISRWHPDGQRPDATPSSWSVKWDGLKLLWNASAARIFDYQLSLSDGAQTYRLVGSKLMQPALTWGELWAWCVNKWKRGGWPAPQRRSAWEQLTQLDVELFAGTSRTPLAQGRLAMDIPEMTRRIAPQMKAGPDTINALAAFISYPLMVLRYLVSSRMLDFRLPDYDPHLPPSDPAAAPDDGLFELPHDKYPPLHVPNGGGVVLAQAPVCLNVPLHAAKPGDALHKPETIRIGLVRYAQPHVQSSTTPQGQRRYKSIILLNGFAQNTLPFVAEELGERALAALLYAQGWDIWLLEYRVSPFLRASARFASMDDIGACDIPAAVNHVLKSLDAERSAPDLLPGQLFVFSHCVGSASMAMSLLGGHLLHPNQQPKVAGVLFSQFQPFVVGSITAQMRLQVASLLVNVLGLEFVEFAAGTSQADGLHALMDRLFASFDYQAHERCPGEHDLRHSQHDSTSCKRMSGFLSRLFRHDQLIESRPGQPGTHEKLDQYFGRTNLGVFLHGAKCVEYGRLVNSDGQNVYVTDDNVRRYLPMPVMLLHGEDNVLFDQESLQETQRQFSRAFGAERLQTQNDRFLLAPGHAHFDCTIGKRAPEVIFGDVVAFFDNAFVAEMPAPAEHNRLRARLPRTGPIVGWTRRVGDKNLLRVWIEVDSTQADKPMAAMTLVSAGPYRAVQAWEISCNPIEGQLGVSPNAPLDMGIPYAVADVEVPADWTGRISVAMVSLHQFTADPPEASDCAPNGWPPAWGLPMTVAEALQTQGRSPRITVPDASGVCAVPAAPAAVPGQPPVVLKSEPLGPPTPYVPGERILPQPLNLSLQDAHAMLAPLMRLVRDQRKLTRKANPNTLSRQRRTMRWMSECVVRLRGDRLLGETAGDMPLRFFASTCRHPGITELETLRSDDTLLALAERQRSHPASLMWMLGDQIYSDARAGFLDSASSIELLLPRYRDAFGSRGFREVARSLPLHMVMDDHEIRDNWSRDELALGDAQNVLYRNALSAFNAFQRAHGPAGMGSAHENSTFSMGGAAFLSLNTRLHRHRALGQSGRCMLDGTQWTLLQDWLLAEQAKGPHPKFLMTGSVFAPGIVQGAGKPSPRDTDSWQLVAAERQRLLSFIASQGISNVVFLSGDYHCSASATVSFSHSAVKAYCLVTPPLHAPLRFANIDAADILPEESIALDVGSAQVSARGWNGDGWLECELQRAPNGGYTLQTLFRAQRIDVATPDWYSETWNLS
jgi:cholesterol oxidase